MRFLVPAVTILFTLGIASLACGENQDNQIKRNATEAEIASPVTPVETPLVLAAHHGDAKGQFACIDGTASAGEASYNIYCTTCHGPGGNGEGPAAAALTPKPAKHNDGAYMNSLTNEHIIKVVAEGGAAVGKSPLMAPWGGVLNEAQIKDVLAYVRSLAVPAYTCP
ncbi:cytochrome c [Myxococcota bacterium]|mgnify:CR=1 FL=1|nr:cytochrome c [Myxococcota bacterium]